MDARPARLPAMNHEPMTPPSDLSEAQLPMSSQVAECLVNNHRTFLRFLESRLGDRDLAEDVLQDAFVRGTERAEQIQSREAILAWCFRLLRNAVVDIHRRRAGQARRLEALAHELGEPAEQPSLHDAVCQCVASLTETLKPEYATALRRIELDGCSVKDYATEAGITANHAGVIVHRARRALRSRLMASCGTCATHGCLDCSCGAGAHE